MSDAKDSEGRRKRRGKPPAPAGASAPAPSLASTEPPPPEIGPGDERREDARARRLARRGFAADRCALLGIPLDDGPRSTPFERPAVVTGHVVSTIGAAILAAGLTPEDLEHAAAWLRAREG